MRLHRALKLLREKLDQEYGGDREGRVRGLALLAGVPASRWSLSSLAVLAALLGVVSVAAVGLLGRGERAAGGEVVGVVDSGLSAGLDPLPTPDERSRPTVTERPVGEDSTAEPDPSPRGPLEVLVLDPDGFPAPDVEVLAEVGRGGLTRRGRTNAAGRFTLQVPLSLLERARVVEPLQLAARGPGGAPSPVTLWPVQHHDPAEVTLRLRRGGVTLRGRVVDQEGTPIPRARVEFGAHFRLGQGFLGGVQVVADGNVGPLLPGQTWAPDEVAALQFDRRVRGFLGPQSISRAGEFERLPGVATTRTDDSGWFSLHGVEAGEQPLRVVAAGFAVHAERVDPAKAPLEVVLTREARLVGRVQGAALRHAFIYVFQEGSAVGVAVEQDGTFALGGLAGGEARVHLRVGARTADEAVTLRAGRATTWDPTPSGAGALSGSLQDHGGQPLVGWTLELRLGSNPAHAFASAISEEGGAFALPPPPPGPLQLTATPPSAATYAAQQVLDGGQLVSPWRLAQGSDSVAQLTGRLVEADGTPLPPETRLVLVAEGNPSGVLVVLGADGSFRSPPLPSGSWRWVLPGLGLASLGDTAVPLAGSDVDMGEVRLSALGVLNLPADQEGSEALQLERVAGDGHVLMVFRGRVSVPCRVPLRAGRWVVRRGASLEQTIVVHEGLEVQVE